MNKTRKFKKHYLKSQKYTEIDVNILVIFLVL